MKDKEKLRKVKNLMYVHHLVWSKSTDRQVIFDLYETHKNKTNVIGKWWARITDLVLLYTLVDELKMTEKEVHDLWFEQSCLRNKLRNEYNKKPQKEGRDNKDVHVGSGNSSNNYSVRYPSKKRSIKTWKKFYNLFPICAIEDGWDGKTSKRMK